jgi:competence protein ComFC
MGILDRGRALLWPDRCILCGGAVAYGEDCCDLCRKRAPFLQEEIRLRGRRTAAVWRHDSPASGAVNRFKFRGDMDTGRKIARRMAWAWRRQCPDFAPDCMTFVPMPEERFRQRGYNQAELLARWAGKELGLPVIPVLEREGVLTQHQLPVSFRRKGAAASFSLPGEREKLVRGRRVLLVDDIITTGDTVDACARLLERAGALEVAVLAAVRAEG